MSDCPLAIFGAPPRFTTPLHVGRPNIGDRAALHRRIDEALDRRWLSNNGQLVQELEARIAAISGTRHAICVANATQALTLVARAMDLRGEVLVPTFTFAATAHALVWAGLDPVFCDIDATTHALDPLDALARASDATSAIVPVHLWGRGGDLEAIAALAHDHRWRIFSDAAHAFACTWHGQPIAAFGEATVFSLHATKFVNAGEGGAIVTDDDLLAKRIRMLVCFGFSDHNEIDLVGTNAKLSELHAAMGLTSLDAMESIVAVNRANHARYSANLSAVPGLSVMGFDPAERGNHQYVVVEVDPIRTGLDRDGLLRVLQAEQVLARSYFACLHQCAAYRRRQTRVPSLPVAERLSRVLMQLPTGTGVTLTDIDGICEILATAVGHAGEVAHCLAA